MKKIFLGADHRGFELKEELKAWLQEEYDEKYEIIDLGNDHYDPEDDFPDFALSVAEAVARAGEEARGIVICGSGVGVNVAANKVRGIRASTGISPDEVRHGRKHDDLNALAISADYTSPDKAKEMIQIFLQTPFDAQDKYTRRLEKISKYETQN